MRLCCVSSRKSQIWLIYTITCMCLILYWCLNMKAMTSQPRFQLLFDKLVTNSRESGVYSRLNYSITRRYVNASVLVSLKADIGSQTLASEQVDLISSFPPTIVNGKDINPDISQFFILRSNETKDVLINLHQYEFSLNSQICSNGDLFLITVVHSAPGNYMRRELIRTTYGSVHMYRNKKLAVVFMLGAVRSKSLQDSVSKESKQHGDIVQGNFQDSYRNLNRKHIMAMHWFNHHCRAEFILKLDDDTFVNPFRIVDYSLKIKPREMTMHCKLRSGEKPARTPRSKWYTPYSQYPFPILPPFCLGFAYLTTQETWNAMYKESENNRLMDMDDLFVSVVLALKAKVQKADMDKMMYPCPRNSVNPVLLNRKAIFIDRRNKCGQKPFRLWKNIQDFNKHV